MNNKPLVSIVIPVYNGANYVANAINSALAQTYENIEILVINDGSSDDGATDDVVKRYDSRVRYIKKENGGVASALNLGIREMNGEFFSWLSHDDFYLPNKVASQINFLATQNFPDVVVYSNHNNLIEASDILFPIRHSMRSDLEFRARELVANNQIHGCSLLIPRKAFDQIGLFDEKLRVAQDYEMWFRIAQKFPFRFFGETVVTGRIHEKQVGIRLHNRVLIENDEFRMNCISELERDEIRAVGNGSFVLGLLYMSMRMARMGCPLSHAYLLSTLKKMVLNRYDTKRERFLALYAIVLDVGHMTMLKLARKIKQNFFK